MRISDWSSDVCSSDLVQVDRFAVAGRRPQLFAEAVGIVRDHRIGGGQNSAGGTVVLLQPQGAGTGIIAQEALHVFDFRAAPAVDRKSTRLNSSHYCATRMPSSA